MTSLPRLPWLQRRAVARSDSALSAAFAATASHRLAPRGTAPARANTVTEPDPPRLLAPGMAQAPAEPRTFRLLFIIITGVLVAAAFYSSVLIFERQKSLHAVSRYNVTWLVSQA